MLAVALSLGTGTEARQKLRIEPSVMTICVTNMCAAVCECPRALLSRAHLSMLPVECEGEIRAHTCEAYSLRVFDKRSTLALWECALCVDPDPASHPTPSTRTTNFTANMPVSWNLVTKSGDADEAREIDRDPEGSHSLAPMPLPEEQPRRATGY